MGNEDKSGIGYKGEKRKKLKKRTEAVKHKGKIEHKNKHKARPDLDLKDPELFKKIKGPLTKVL